MAATGDLPIPAVRVELWGRIVDQDDMYYLGDVIYERPGDTPIGRVQVSYVLTEFVVSVNRLLDIIQENQ